jgi:bacillopeptidase F (M6 metalloprotease family)
MVFLGTTVYAGSHMVVVFDVESGDVVNVYDAKTSGVNEGGKFTFDGEVVAKDSLTDKDFTVNKKGVGKTTSKIKEKTKGGAYGIPDYTVILSAASPGCITYTYRGYSYTVCN